MVDVVLSASREYGFSEVWLIFKFLISNFEIQSLKASILIGTLRCSISVEQSSATHTILTPENVRLKANSAKFREVFAKKTIEIVKDIVRQTIFSK